ncbi:serpin A3-8-like [Sorex araneus]|uniref:serpin A3-8-like n=1 Tax=Sorex araneus TaxID=42254 RepID=UPI002433CE89|nr:serpin A3-8-like [Sorex araneus]
MALPEQFSISGDYDLKQVLCLLGIRSVFSHHADFSGITEDQRLSISQVSWSCGLIALWGMRSEEPATWEDAVFDYINEEYDRLVHISDIQELRVKIQGTYHGPPVDISRQVHRNNEFTFNLYRLLAARDPSINIIFSPLSVSMALAFLALGTGGHTKTEILQGLKFNLTETPEADIYWGFHLARSFLNMTRNILQLNMTTTLFVDQQLVLKKDFQKKAQALYGAKATSVDFQNLTTTVKLINDYVEQKTNGKILDVVLDLNKQTKMLLVNSLLFKAKWMTPFDPTNTFMSDFYASDITVLKTPMMKADKLEVLYLRDKELSCTLVQLPYTSSVALALLILPDQGNMSKVEAALLPDTLQRWRKSLRLRTASLYLPRFSLSEVYDLEEVLPKLGIAKVFSQEADFSGLTPARNASLSRVVHTALLDVSENGSEGTKGDAARGNEPNPLGTSPNIITVNFNRPFLVAVISEDTQRILFLGKVANPTLPGASVPYVRE